MELRGARTLVTGAAGGLGQAIARRLREEGAELVLSGRRPEALHPLATELGARPVVADLSSREDVERLALEAGAIDVLVANAALPGSGELESFTTEHLDRALDVNLRAPIVLARTLLPGMRARGRGHLVFVSSLSGKAATERSLVYSATKFGLRGFALGLRADLHGSAVGASLVTPGFISDAGMFADSGVTLPFFVRTRTPGAVSAAVVRAITRDVAEIDVAPLSARAATRLAQLAPEIAARGARAAGSAGIARAFASGQADRR